MGVNQSFLQMNHTCSAPVLVEFECGNHDIAGVDANGSSGTVRLVPLHTLNVDNPLLAVHLGDLALTTLVLSADDADLVILANGDGSDLYHKAKSPQIPTILPAQKVSQHTLYLARRSLARVEDMILRRIEDGAEKWALRDLRRDEETSGAGSRQKNCSPHPHRHPSRNNPIQPKIHL